MPLDLSSALASSKFKPGVVTAVVRLSGGVPSYFAAKRAIEKYGRENVVCLFADTRMEDEDLYRFLGQATESLGVNTRWIAEGRTPWEVMFDERLIGNSRRDPCSKILKRHFMDRWMKANGYTPENSIVVVGLTWDEHHRLDTFRERMYPQPVDAPLCDPPYLDRDQMCSMLRAEGIEPPRLYGLGFSHNNCGGFCIKAGQAQFRLLLKYFPKRYAEHEAKEEALRAIVGDHSIMRDRRGGESKPLTMKSFREQIEVNEAHFDCHDWGGCGCAID